MKFGKFESFREYYFDYYLDITSKDCRRQPLKNLKGHRLLKHTIVLQIF